MSGGYYLCKPSGTLLSDIDFSRVVYARDKKVLRITLSKDDKYRLFSHINASGSFLKEAVLLKEDRYFYYHPGINPIAIFRAIMETYIRRSSRIGGSTITMQLARLYYGLHTRTISGKLQQMLYALYLELYYSKDDILEAYLNLAPCGGNVEGFAAAAMLYFEKELPDITLQEALFLSVLPQNPSKYKPKSREIAEALTEARLRLYQLWQEEWQVKPTSEDRAHATMPLNTHYFVPYRAPHFTRSVLKTTKEKRVYTTLDWKYQQLVTRLTRNYVQRKKSLGVENAAVLLVDYKNNMEVLASLGSADFFDAKIQGQVDGTRARRSPGSTLKPIVYALAMDQGLIHPMTVVKDAPTAFSGYAPDNYEGDFKGPVKAWEALINSRNVPAVSLASQIQSPDLYDLLKTLNLGDLKPKEHYGLSIVLGSAEFSMRELVALYGMLANNGTFQYLNDTYNTKIPQNKPTAKQFLSPEASWLTKHILMQNPNPNHTAAVAYGNAYAAQKPIQGAIGYKTGTSIGFKDCWSIAIFDRYVLAVWLGNFDGYGNGIFNGRQLATPLLFEIATNILRENAKAPGYQMSDDMQHLPSGIRRVEVCAASGLLAHPHCKQKLPTYFIPGTSSIHKCDICRQVYVNTQTGYRAYKKGKNVRSEVYEFWPTDILKIFRKAGVPRKTPPMYDPRAQKEAFNENAGDKGFAPKITSPMAKTVYLLSPGETVFNNLPLAATADADVTEIYWFVNEQFIGRSAPEETQFWSLQPGTFDIGVVDDKGQSTSQTVKIGVATN